MQCRLTETRALALMMNIDIKFEVDNRSPDVQFQRSQVDQVASISEYVTPFAILCEFIVLYLQVHYTICISNGIDRFNLFASVSISISSSSSVSVSVAVSISVVVSESKMVFLFTVVLACPGHQNWVHTI